jgi:hypothetical protein
MHESTMKYLKPSEEQLATMDTVRAVFADTLTLVDNLLPPGRYKSLAITAIEEAAMWANKAITRESDGTPREGATT